MDYLLDNVNGRILKKLHKTCKYFFVKKEFTILDEFMVCEGLIGNERSIKKYSIEISSRDEDLNLLKPNLILLEKFFLFECPPLPSRVVSKIVQCDIHFLWVICENLTLKDLMFLTKSGNITFLSLQNRVYYSDGLTPVPPEEIFSLVPKVTTFS